MLHDAFNLKINNVTIIRSLLYDLNSWIQNIFTVSNFVELSSKLQYLWFTKKYEYYDRANATVCVNTYTYTIRSDMAMLTL